MSAMTSGLIPIAGAGTNEGKGAKEKKSDLSSGLISIASSTRGSQQVNDDLDFSDFNLDDLLMDDTDKPSKSKSKESKSDKTSKSKSSSKKDKSSKKKKDKTSPKKVNIGSDEDDWDSSRPSKSISMYRDDVETRPKGMMKSMTLDDEFARMLGLEDEFSNLASKSPPQSVAKDDEKEEKRDSLDRWGDIPSDKVSVERQPTHSDTTQAIVESDGDNTVAGLSASFFQENENEGRSEKDKEERDKEDSFLSFLSSSTSERRGGRRQASKPVFADPFEKKLSSEGALSDLFAPKPKPLKEDMQSKDRVESLPMMRNRNGPEEPTRGKEEIVRTVINTSKNETSAKEDLLAELFPSIKAPDKIKRDTYSSGDVLSELFPSENFSPKKEEAITIHPTKESNLPSPPILEKNNSPINIVERTSSPIKTSIPQPESPSVKSDMPSIPIKSSKMSDKAVENARDQLLKDLLPDSPPRTRPSPVTSSPTHKSNPTTDPIKPSVSPSLSPSPGKTKTLAMGTPSKAREVAFEQTKDDLLTEILYSPPPSPTSRPSRRGSSPLPSPPRSIPIHPSSSWPSALEQELIQVKEQHSQEVQRLKALHEQDLRRLQQEHETRFTLVEAEKTSIEKQLQDIQAASQLVETAFHTLEREHGQLKTQYGLIETQHSQCTTETTDLRQALARMDEQNRLLHHQLLDAKQATQRIELQLEQRTREWEDQQHLTNARQQQQMERLSTQLETSLIHMRMIQQQEQDETHVKREVETTQRLQMITTLEATSRGYAQQTQDECQRLQTLLYAFDTTLRQFRQDHFEEKERLRQEQERLSILSQHFQAQTTILHQQSESNHEILTKYLTQSLQDVRIAEARVATRQQQVREAEQAVAEERAHIATWKEQILEAQSRECAKLNQETSRLSTEWRELEKERDELETMIATHEQAFQTLQHQQQALEQEKERIAQGALHVAEMAARFETCTREMMEKEQRMGRERQAMEQERMEWERREQEYKQGRLQMEKREERLHLQMKQLEKMRQEWKDERRTKKISVSPIPPPIPLKSKERKSISNNQILSPTPDPSGLSPSFRQLMEQHWNQQSNAWQRRHQDHRERMAIHCVGLDTSATRPPVVPQRSTPVRIHL